MKKIGIIGFGVVGKSALRFFSKIYYKNGVRRISIWDQQEIDRSDCVSSSEKSLEQFCEENDQLLVSPGVDFRAYKKYLHKCVSELDIFSDYFSKKTIAITGTLGKTTTTKLLQSLLSGKVAIGGNVGRAMLNLIHDQEAIDTVILELSSFQLESNTKFAPDIAIWTNFYPNHLDRHETMDAYFDAKCNIFAYQTKDQFLVLSEDLQHGLYGERLKKKLESCKAQVLWITKDSVSHNLLSNVPNISFQQNWILIFKVLDLCGVSVEKVINRIARSELSCDSHRLEYVTTVNGVDFFNDSKATVAQATQAAVERLSQNNRSIILILGGIDKGVDRSDLVSCLSKTKYVKKILCFGEAKKSFPEYESYDSLEDVVFASVRHSQENDQILFSPSGASFDLFANYKERGDAFKKIVLEMDRE